MGAEAVVFEQPLRIAGPASSGTSLRTRCHAARSPAPRHPRPGSARLPARGSPVIAAPRAWPAWRASRSLAQARQRAGSSGAAGSRRGDAGVIAGPGEPRVQVGAVRRQTARFAPAVEAGTIGEPAGPWTTRLPCGSTHARSTCRPRLLRLNLNSSRRGSAPCALAHWRGRRRRATAQRVTAHSQARVRGPLAVGSRSCPCPTIAPSGCRSCKRSGPVSFCASRANLIGKND